MSTMRRKLIAFDLDDTITVSKSTVTPAMAARLVALLGLFDVAIISGGRFEQFDRQLLSYMPAAPDVLDRLHVLPTSGTRYHRLVDGEWRALYAEDLSADEKADIVEVLTSTAHRLGLWESQVYGDVIEDRGSQVTFSALGQDAPPEAKYAWDPDDAKKRSLRDAAAHLLPGMSVRMGGRTSVDVTRQGIDKAYGMRRLLEATGLDKSAVLYFGDQLQPGGNDFPVKEMGIATVEVGGCAETLVAIDAVLAMV